MKKYSWVSGFLLSLLCALTVTVFILCAAASLICEKSSLYKKTADPEGELLDEMLTDRAQELMNEVYDYVISGDGIDCVESNACWRIYGQDTGRLLFESEQYDELYREKELSFCISLAECDGVTVGWLSYDEYPAPDAEEFVEIYGTNEKVRLERYRISIGLRAGLPVTDDFYHAVSLIRFADSAKYAVLIVGGAAFIVSVLLFIILISRAGYKGEGELFLRGFDRIPFDLLTAVSAAVILMLSAAAIDAAKYAYRYYDVFAVLASAGAVFAVDLIGVEYIVSLASRVRNQTLLKNTVVVRCVRGIVRFMRKLRFRWRLTVGLAVSTAVLMLLASLGASEYEAFMLICAILWLAAMVVIVIASENLHRIREGTRIIASGNIESQISYRHMLPLFRSQAKDINAVRDGFSAAVNARIKSERLKTELITNVSHDIKTPLTSIVNYVDLLKKEKLEGNSAEYVEVLDRQSQRLKKLITDLVEASRASTGNIRATPERTSLNIILSQVAGEYEDRLAGAGLELIQDIPERELFIMADGRLMWRMMENLMSNVTKYSLGGTRVYISVKRLPEGRAQMVIKNISRDELNITADELTERFVRGDRSRNTEGSGLGLNIAKSLAEIQNMELEIVLDGDLFKVFITFDEVL